MNFFHAWNVKNHQTGRFRFISRTLKEDYTTMLWFAEGVTNYYGDIVMQRSGIRTREEYYEHLMLRLRQILLTPGRKVSSLEKASFDSWYRHYQFNANTAFNVSVSYYKKGELVTLMLDLYMRHLTKNNYCFDDVMRQLYTIGVKEKRGVSTL